MRILFVTGKLAEASLRRTLAELAPRAGFEYDVAVLNIAVAALMTPAWVARKLDVPPGFDRVVLPGFCDGDLSVICDKAGVPVESGPKDLRDLPSHFGKARAEAAGYGRFDLEIIAEINHCPRLPADEILAAARRYREDGADVIDVGCDPAGGWAGAADVVRMLRGEGFRVSIDSLDPREIAPAVAAGAELVLSVNSANLDAIAHLPCEFVAVPDTPADFDSLVRTVGRLAERGAKFRLDPILEPIGLGFAESLGGTFARREFPDREILMGVGNVTELTEADSAGLNTMLAGICQETGIRSVLTTAVANWARSSVKELDLARKLMHHAVTQRTIPKYLEPKLLLLRDRRPTPFGEDELRRMAAMIKDRNWRLFAENGTLYAMNSEKFLSAADPFDLFAQMGDVDPAHAFYLGYELAKAVTALTLNKAYRQDQALDWGFLTAPEAGHRDDRKRE